MTLRDVGLKSVSNKRQHLIHLDAVLKTLYTASEDYVRLAFMPNMLSSCTVISNLVYL